MQDDAWAGWVRAAHSGVSVGKPAPGMRGRAHLTALSGEPGERGRYGDAERVADVRVAIGDWAQAEGSAKGAMCPVLCGLWPGKGRTASAGGSGPSPPRTASTCRAWDTSRAGGSSPLPRVPVIQKKTKRRLS